MSKGLVQIRRGTSTLWTSTNTLLKNGELALDNTNGRLKVGDGSTLWNSLAYMTTKTLSTSGVPSAGTGVDGDFAIDSTAKVMYGPKAAGAWPAGVSYAGTNGTNGTNGWSPILAVVSNGGTGFVYQIVGWTGGTGSPPSSTNQFIGSSGIVSTAAAAQDIRGAAGSAGSAGAGVPTGGATGTFLQKNSATNFDTLWAPVPAGYITTAMQAAALANSLRGEFTGASVSPQDLSLAANTFAARGSTGNITAKTIADVGLTFLAATTVAAQTALLNAVTQSLQGMMSALDKRLVDDLHYDFVADFGGVGNDSTLNDTQFATALSTMPAGAVLFIPAGTFRVSAAIDINVDKRITFKGVNRYASIIKTTSATAHIFTKSVAGWYDMWTDLGFQSSVTKTAGAAINIPIGNNIGMNVYRCWFTGMFQAINATGNQSANLSVWSDLDISAVTNGGRGIFVNGATINVMIHNVTINAGAATTSACVEIQSSGAVQVTNCDWIQGTNVVLFNAASALGAQACYFTNCFFDQPQGSVVKVIGGFTSGRLNFSQCGIAPTGNNHAVEVNGTGAGAVGTTTALPAGIKLASCDIYCAVGTGTGAGIRVNGCQDITVQNCNITGFNGTGGAAVWITPSISNQTKVRINGNIMGPNSNLTITNATGVLLDIGSSSLGLLSVTDNSMLGCGTAITDNSTILAGVSKNINNNMGAAAGLSAGLFAPAGVALTATEAIIAQIPLPANSCKVGTTFQFAMNGISTATAMQVKLHIGPLGTIADPAVIATAATVAGTAGGLDVSGMAQISVVGATAGGSGSARVSAGTMTNTTAVTATGTFNSAVANYATLSAIGAAGGHTVRAAVMEIFSPA